MSKIELGASEKIPVKLLISLVLRVVTGRCVKRQL
jgi:hypothetical protein